jgi:hypothetical protein
MLLLDTQLDSMENTEDLAQPFETQDFVLLEHLQGTKRFQLPFPFSESSSL